MNLAPGAPGSAMKITTRVFGKPTYGDAVPRTSLASALTTLEEVVGQLYLVTTVAWLVGVRVSQSTEKKSQ
jgi:hypothetical protein